MKKIIIKIFHPNKIVGFLLCFISVILLIYVFSMHLEDTPLAHFSYLLSTYALIIFCIWFFKACQFSNDFLKKSKHYQWFQQNHSRISKLSLIFSSIINLGFGLLKCFTGIYYQSTWFITFGAYYLLLWFMKLSLIKSVHKNGFGKNLIKEYQKLKQVGIVLLFLDIVLAGMIILIIHQKEAVSYPGYLIYVVALYDFYLVIAGIVNVIKYKNTQSPVLSASKFINLTAAMIAMISLEVAMISQFGDGDAIFRTTMVAISGFAVTMINSVIAIYMIRKSQKHLKIIKKK